MIIKKLSINNLQLIKSAQVDFEKINIISGKNLDSPNESGNGSGKSTLVLRAILFCLYGYCEEGLKLVDLIRFGEKECSVEIECLLNNEQYKIIRKIPTQLQLFKNDVEIQANTTTIKQKMIDDTFGDVNFFRQYRCVDLKNGINVLDLGIISLRKTLMAFMEDYFSNIRKNLLIKKVERERYSIDRRLYKCFLSNKRLSILTDGLKIIKEENLKIIKEQNQQQEIINQIKSEIQSKEKLIYYKKKDIEKLNNGYCPIIEE